MVGDDLPRTAELEYEMVTVRSQLYLGVVPLLPDQEKLDHFVVPELRGRSRRKARSAVAVIRGIHPKMERTFFKPHAEHDPLRNRD